MEKNTIRLSWKSERECYNKDTALFYMAFYLMVFAKAFGLWSIHKSYYVMFGVAALLLLIKILISLKSREAFWGIIVVLVPSILVFLHSRETTLLFTCLFLAATKDIDFETCVKGGCSVSAFAVLLRVLLYLCGVVEGGSKAIYHHNSAGEPYLAGYTYGYGYVTPNMFFAAVFVFVILFLYLRRERIKLLEIGLTTVLVVGVFYLTKCKTGLIVYLVMMVAIGLCKLFPDRRFIRLSFCGLVILGSVILGMILPFFFSLDNSLMFYINEYLISGRLLLSNAALTKYGVTLLGTGGVFADILYMDVLLNSGLVGLCMLLLGFGITVWGFIRDRDDMGLICITAMILYACMEQFPLNVAMNPFLLYLGTNVLFKTGEIKDKSMD